MMLRILWSKNSQTVEEMANVGVSQCLALAWHEILGHVGVQKILKTYHRGTINGLEIAIFKEDFLCKPSILENMSKKPFKLSQFRDCSPGEFI